MAKMVMVEALADFPYSADGTTTTEAKKGQTFELAEDTAIQLESLETPLVKRAAEDAAPDAVKPATTEVEVASPANLSAGMSAETTELSDDAKAALTEARTTTTPTPVKPEIEPVEHGGPTIDRDLTRGVHPDAVVVEDADSAAAAGKVSSGTEINEVLQDVPDDEKDAGAAPENKTVRRSRK
jgi:hypothetical protein